MRDRLADLGTDCDVTLVVFGDADVLTDYVAQHPLPFPVRRDPDRAAYAAFGFGRGSWTRVWGRQAATRYVELLREDGIGGLRRPRQDTRQLGGDIVIDAGGRLAYGFWGDGPDDRPTVDELVDAVRRAR